MPKRLPRGGRPNHYTGNHRRVIRGLELLGWFMALAGVTLIICLCIIYHFNLNAY